MESDSRFQIGDYVVKTSGDYKFAGEIVVVFRKKSGAVRYVVENRDGVLLILNEQQLSGCQR